MVDKLSECYVDLLKIHMVKYSKEKFELTFDVLHALREYVPNTKILETITEYINLHMKKYIRCVGYEKLCKLYFENKCKNIIIDYMLNNLSNYVIKIKPRVKQLYATATGNLKSRMKQEDYIFVSLARHGELTGDSSKKKLCVYRHSADVPDLGVDVVYNPIVCIVNLNNMWFLYDDTISESFDILCKTKNLHKHTKLYKQKLENFDSRKKLKLPPFESDSFINDFCILFMDEIIEYVDDIC